MGCDIHSYAEAQHNSEWTKAGEVFPLDDFDREWSKKAYTDRPFHWRGYGLFGWLADVRNYSHSPVIVEPRGLPLDISPEVRDEYNGWREDAHSCSWLSLAELIEADYDQVFWDRRITRQEAPGMFNGAALAGAGEGERRTLREFLGEGYFETIEILKTLGKPEDVRVVFWFDN